MRKNYSILDEMRRMQEHMDLMFGNFFDRDPFFGHNLLENKPRNLIESNYKQPVCDLYENKKELIVEVEIPGVDKKDIKVHVSNDGIEIKAENKIETKNEDKKKGMYNFERNYTGFYRRFSLPNNVNSEKAHAEYKNGILKITVPKLKIEESKKKLIDVK